MHIWYNGHYFCQWPEQVIKIFIILGEIIYFLECLRVDIKYFTSCALKIPDPD